MCRSCCCPEQHVLKLFAFSPNFLSLRGTLQYGCSRGVVATPTFAVNGVTVPGADESWSIYDWRTLLEPLVPPKAKPGPAGTLDAEAAADLSL